MVVAQHKKSEALKRSKKVCSNSFVMKHEKSPDKKYYCFQLLIPLKRIWKTTIGNVQPFIHFIMIYQR